jgi:hypothetical protein
MQLFNADSTIFFLKIPFFLPTKSLKNNPQKLLRNTQFIFLPYCPELPWPELPKQPKQKNPCPKMWFIDQLDMKYKTGVFIEHYFV